MAERPTVPGTGMMSFRLSPSMIKLLMPWVRGPRSEEIIVGLLAPGRASRALAGAQSALQHLIDSFTAGGRG
jgi:hypothetical protein